MFLISYFQEYISLSTEFLTLCFFNVAAITLRCIITFLEIYQFFYISFAWILLLAPIPIIWISRNKKMIKKAKIVLGIA